MNVNVNGRAESRRQPKWPLPRGCPIHGLNKMVLYDF